MFLPLSFLYGQVVQKNFENDSGLTIIDNGLKNQVRFSFSGDYNYSDTRRGLVLINNNENSDGRATLQINPQLQSLIISLDDISLDWEEAKLLIAKNLDYNRPDPIDGLEFSDREIITLANGGDFYLPTKLYNGAIQSSLFQHTINNNRNRFLHYQRVFQELFDQKRLYTLLGAKTFKDRANAYLLKIIPFTEPTLDPIKTIVNDRDLINELSEVEKIFKEQYPNDELLPLGHQYLNAKIKIILNRYTGYTGEILLEVIFNQAQDLSEAEKLVELIKKQKKIDKSIVDAAEKTLEDFAVNSNNKLKTILEGLRNGKIRSGLDILKHMFISKVREKSVYFIGLKKNRAFGIEKNELISPSINSLIIVNIERWKYDQILFFLAALDNINLLLSKVAAHEASLNQSDSLSLLRMHTFGTWLNFLILDQIYTSEDYQKMEPKPEKWEEAEFVNQITENRKKITDLIFTEQAVLSSFPRLMKELKEGYDPIRYKKLISEFGGNSQRTGYFPIPGPQNGTLNWKFDSPNIITSSPSYDELGNTYIGSGFYLYAIDERGKEKWKFLTKGRIDSSSVVRADGTIYFGSDRHLYAINRKGKLVWKFKTENIITSSPALGKNSDIVFGGIDETLYILNSRGELRWKFKTKGKIESSPTIDLEGNIYITSQDNNLYFLNSDGNKIWQTSVGETSQSTPALRVSGSNEIIYFGGLDNQVYAVSQHQDRGRGEVLWSFPTSNDIYSSPALAPDGTVYIGSHDGNLYAISPEGNYKWAFQTEGSILSSPVIDGNNIVYVGSHDKHLYAINPDGSLKWKQATGGAIYSRPTIRSNEVIIGSADGSVYSFK